MPWAVPVTDGAICGEIRRQSLSSRQLRRPAELGELEMVSRRDKVAAIAQQYRRNIISARLSRRDVVKLGLLTAAGTLALKSGLSARANGGRDEPINPPTPPAVRDGPP